MSTVALIGVAVTGIAMLLVLVAVVKLEAFVSLILTSMVVALLAGIPITEIISAIEEGMGSTLGAIAIIIGFGAMFGEMLRVSGGTKQLATTLVDRFGEQWAPWAMGLTGFLVSISVFFDVGLIVLLPLAYSLTQRSGRSLLYYALPLGAGLAATHGYIPPTPGPTAIAAELNVDLGWVILFGLIAGIPALWVGGIVFSRFIAEARFFNRHDGACGAGFRNRLDGHGGGAGRACHSAAGLVCARCGSHCHCDCVGCDRAQPRQRLGLLARQPLFGHVGGGYAQVVDGVGDARRADGVFGGVCAELFYSVVDNTGCWKNSGGCQALFIVVLRVKLRQSPERFIPALTP